MALSRVKKTNNPVFLYGAVSGTETVSLWGSAAAGKKKKNLLVIKEPLAPLICASLPATATVGHSCRRNRIQQVRQSKWSQWFRWDGGCTVQYSVKDKEEVNQHCLVFPSPVNTPRLIKRKGNAKQCCFTFVLTSKFDRKNKILICSVA